MNYKIITDEAALKAFIDWLPACHPWEQVYCSLFSRKKFFEHPACKYDKTMIKRFTSTKERLFNKIKQLECPLGCYLGANDIPIPQESLGFYVSLNPRDLRKSFTKGIKAFADILDKDISEHRNPRQEIMNVIQTTSGERHFHVFDVDSKESGVLDECISLVNGHCAVIETRGGYHVLVKQSAVESGLITEKRWYEKLKEKSDVTNDC